MCGALVPQYFQSRPLDQGARDRGHAQGNPGQRGYRGGAGTVRVIEKLRTLRLINAAELMEMAVEETLTYYAFPEEHWRRIRTTDVFDKRFPSLRSLFGPTRMALRPDFATPMWSTPSRSRS